MNPHLIISTMNHFNCSAMEAQHFLNLDNNKAMLFSNGNIHIPMSWNKNTTNEDPNK